MARPREFDEDNVLGKALDVFWAKGFDGASISDLSEATGLGRASLYAAFGDKEGLFQAALQKFKSTNAESMPTLDQAASGAAWLRDFFVRIPDIRGKGKPKGCFVQASATHCGSDRKQSAALLQLALKETEDMLRRAVQRAHAERGVAADKTVDEITSFLLTLLHGINASARVGRTAEALRRDILIGLDAVGIK